MRDDCCIFILSHGRPSNIPTIGSLKRYGYTGDYYIVIDHEEERQDYIDEWGDDTVLYYDKSEIADDIDRADNRGRMNINVYARNKVFDFADELGYDYFLVFDDDYTNIQWRFDADFNYNPNVTRDLNMYIENAIEYLEDAGLHTLCMAQGGDFIGGEEASMAQKVRAKRKAMNSFLFKTDRRVEFVGSINEDVNTYVRKQQLGQVFLTTNVISIEQESTQQEEGGLTDIYLDAGTYQKSFYTILYSPSSASLTLLQDRTEPRIHHRVNWRASVPKIVPESVKSN